MEFTGDGYLVSNTSDTRLLTANSISGGTATASSSQSGDQYKPSNAADGSDATYWRSAGGPPQWWQYDFGSSGATLRMFGIRHYPNAGQGNYINNIYLSGSQDNAFSSYTALTAVLSSTGYVDEDNVNLGYARWQYWKFTNTQNYRYYRWNMVDQYYYDGESPPSDILIWDFRAYEEFPAMFINNFSYSGNWFETSYQSGLSGNNDKNSWNWPANPYNSVTTSQIYTAPKFGIVSGYIQVDQWHISRFVPLSGGTDVLSGNYYGMRIQSGPVGSVTLGFSPTSSSVTATLFDVSPFQYIRFDVLTEGPTATPEYGTDTVFRFNQLGLANTLAFPTSPTGWWREISFPVSSLTASTATQLSQMEFLLGASATLTVANLMAVDKLYGDPPPIEVRYAITWDTITHNPASTNYLKPLRRR